MTSLTAFDIVVLLLIGFGALAGLARGFVTEVLSLLAWVAAIFAVRLFYPAGKIIATRLTGTESGGAILAFVLIFAVTFVVFKGVGGALGARTRNSVVGPLDRVLGLGFGAFKGLLGASVLFLLGTMVFDVLDPESPRPEWLRAARTAPLVEATSKAMVDFVETRRQRKPATPEGAAPRQRSALDRLLEAAREKPPK